MSRSDFAGTSSVSEFVRALQREGITLWVDHDELRYRAREGTMPDWRLAQLRALKPELLSFLRAQVATEEREPELRAFALEGLHPTSFLQQTFVARYGQLSNPAIQSSWSIKRLIGKLESSILVESCRLVVSRHAALRTRYVLDGERELRVAIAGSPDLEFDTIELNPTRDDGDETLTGAITRTLSRRFDLERGPLVRLLLARLGAREHVLVLCAHHSICDGWSLRIMLHELFAAYYALCGSTAPQLPVVVLHDTDHTRWFNQLVETSAYKRHVSYWHSLVQGGIGPFELPRDVPAVHAEDGRYMTAFEVPEDTLHALRAMARNGAVTMSAVALTAFAAALARWRRNADVFVKVVHHGRRRPELFNVVGCFANCSVVRARMDGHATFKAAVAHVHRAHCETLPHLDVHWRHIRQELAKLPGGQPQLDIHFNYHGAADGTTRRLAETRPLHIQELKLRRPLQPLGAPHELDESAGTQLNVSILESADRLRCAVRYVGSRFSASTIDALCRACRDLLTDAARTSGASPLETAPD